MGSLLNKPEQHSHNVNDNSRPRREHESSSGRRAKNNARQNISRSHSSQNDRIGNPRIRYRNSPQRRRGGGGSIVQYRLVRERVVGQGQETQNRSKRMRSVTRASQKQGRSQRMMSNRGVAPRKRFTQRRYRQPNQRNVRKIRRSATKRKRVARRSYRAPKRHRIAKKTYKAHSQQRVVRRSNRSQRKQRIARKSDGSRSPNCHAVQRKNFLKPDQSMKRDRDYMMTAQESVVSRHLHNDDDYVNHDPLNCSEVRRSLVRGMPGLPATPSVQKNDNKRFGSGGQRKYQRRHNVERKSTKRFVTRFGNHGNFARRKVSKRKAKKKVPVKKRKRRTMPKKSDKKRKEPTIPKKSDNCRRIIHVSNRGIRKIAKKVNNDEAGSSERHERVPCPYHDEPYDESPEGAYNTRALRRSRYPCRCDDRLPNNPPSRRFVEASSQTQLESRSHTGNRRNFDPAKKPRTNGSRK